MTQLPEVSCRARLEDVRCLHGLVGVVPMERDFTWDPKTETVICDSCFQAASPFMPYPTLEGADQGVEVYRDNLRFVTEAGSMPALHKVVAGAERYMVTSPVGTPLYVSALATVAMALREVERRASLN